MGSALIVERILNELEAGQADGVERKMIGAAGVAHGERRDAEILERRNPLPEDRLLCGIALEIDPADLSGAVVDIEVRIERLPLRLGFDGTGGLADELRQLHRLRIGGEREGSEVLFDIAL